MPSKKAPENKAQDGPEVVGPFSEDRYIPSQGVWLKAGDTLKVEDEDKE